MTNLDALHDRYLEFGLRPPEHVEEEVPEIEDLEQEPVRLWVTEGKKPPSLKVRWFLHEEAPRDEQGWFARHVTIPSSLSWTVHVAAVFFVAFWPSTRLEIAMGQEGIPVEIVFAPNLTNPVRVATGPQEFALEESFTSPVAQPEPSADVAAVEEPALQETEAFEGADPEPPTIEDLIASEIGEQEQVDAMSAIAQAPEPELPDVEPIPEPEPPPPPPPVQGTGPETPDPVEVAEPDMEPAEAAPEPEPGPLEELFGEGELAAGPEEELAPELFEPEELARDPLDTTPEVDVAVDGNDIPVEQEGETEVAEAPPPEPVAEEPAAEAVEPEPVAESAPEPVAEPLPETAAEQAPPAEPVTEEPPVEQELAETESELLPEPEVEQAPLPEAQTEAVAETEAGTALTEPEEPLEPVEPEQVAEAPPIQVEEAEAPPLFSEPASAPSAPAPEADADPLDEIEPDRELAEQSLAALLEEAQQDVELPEEPGLPGAEETIDAEPTDPLAEVAAAPPEVEGPATPIPSARPFTIEDPEPEPEPQPEPEPEPEQIAEAPEAPAGQAGGTGQGTGIGTGDGTGGSQVATAPAQPRTLPNSLITGANRPPPTQPSRPAQQFKPASFNDPSLDNTIPTYPERLRVRGIEGTVILRVVVGTTGDPISVEVQRSSGSRELDQVTRQTVAGWKFTPAERNGQPVIDDLLLPFNFRLQ